jgi:hypothetical protein
MEPSHEASHGSPKTSAPQQSQASKSPSSLHRSGRVDQVSRGQTLELLSPTYHTF